MIDDLVFPERPERPDPLRAARAAAAPVLPRRFWNEVSLEPGPEGFRLLLDGRPARTPARAPLALPGAAAGEVIAAEWRAVGEVLDPALMPATRIANAAIDHVSRAMEAVRADILAYAGSDLVLYRAGEPERLVQLQGAEWDPVLAFARERLGASFIASEGIRHVTQPEAALDAVRAALGRIDCPLKLAALHVVTALSGSALLALMLAEGAVGAQAAFAKGELDADYQASVWGLDAEAARARAARQASFMAAAALLSA